MREVTEEELKADEEFWNQDFFQESQNDEEYEESTEEEDIADSDFDKSEHSDGDNGEAEKEVRRFTRSTKKKSVYVDHAKKPIKNTKTESEHTQTQTQKMDYSSEVITKKSLRASTLSKSEQLEKRQKIEKDKVKRKAKPVVQYQRLTQQELLREASQTEVENQRLLEEMLKSEAAKKAITQSQPIVEGPRIRFHSKNGVQSITFSEASIIPSVLQQKLVQYPPPKKCVITGEHAKYTDPLTKLPYSSLQAFQQLRKSWEEQSSARLQQQVNMTALSAFTSYS